MATSGRKPRTLETRGGSERSGFAGCVVTTGFVRNGVKPTGLNIALKLAVPSGPIVFQKPGAKLRKLVRRERLNLLLEFFDFAHGHQPSIAV